MHALTIRRSLAAAFALVALTLPLAAQDEPQIRVAPAPEASAAADFDTGYRPSAYVSTRVQRAFLEELRWSAGTEIRDSLAAAFAERKPVDIWQDLVADQGLTVNNVADALTAYWVLNWITANGAYTAKIDNAPIQRQLRVAFANDANFVAINDQKRQQLAEGYILNFLLEHAALNQAVASRDLDALNRMAAASVTRFQRSMGLNLLALVPSEEGFRARPRD
ncbi:hypothetical protein O9Z70_04035 [Devosia sp. YIM 151766]|uniref:DUF6683 family protein n=1 Tax=Devosia sp. YIM 151766 TaxID=3017325 RepID=UPI00255C51E1|nr:DUF6683 family protein [Devosia sp. YIM 151766]WIY53720.1 hypothetical protein O9Z70_04035 [Devosia sp. YIM 151766]